MSSSSGIGWARRLRGASVDVEPIGRQPVRTADNLIVLKLNAERMRSRSGMFAATNRPPGCATMYTRGSSEVCSFTDATSNCARCAPAVTPAAVTTRTTQSFATT